MIMSGKPIDVRPVGPASIVTLNLYFIFVLGIIIQIRPVVIIVRGMMFTPTITPIRLDSPMIFIALNSAMC
jgi:hypothetical protein